MDAHIHFTSIPIIKRTLDIHYSQWSHSSSTQCPNLTIYDWHRTDLAPVALVSESDVRARSPEPETGALRGKLRDQGSVSQDITTHIGCSNLK